MGQLNFQQQWALQNANVFIPGDKTLYFFPCQVYESISLNTVNFGQSFSSINQTHTVNLGLYSLSGSSLSLANSGSVTFSTNNSARAWIAITTFSATQNITPGTWWWGFNLLTGGVSNPRLFYHGTALVSNNFPGSFIGGRQTATTNALPASVATSDLDIAGVDAMFVGTIIISA